jgi:Ca2+-binding RTX toxin-like protein
MAQFNGTEGHDFFFGTEEDDIIFGNGGDDDLHGAGGNDFVDGGDGNDILSGGAGDDFVSGGAGNDNVGWIAGNDTVLGGEGDDFVSVAPRGAAEDVFVSGGSGTDWLEFSGSEDVRIDLGKGMLHTSFQGQDVAVRLDGLENVMALIDSDAHVTGDAGANFIFTGNGVDTLIGGGGRDTLWGAPGDDLYVLNFRPGEADAPHIIFDKFTVEEQGFAENDRIALDRHVMKELGAKGDFSADDERFYAAAGASGGAEADDRVIYDTEAGRLYYDADGSGSGEAQLIATIGAFGNDLAASDITVI